MKLSSDLAICLYVSVHQGIWYCLIIENMKANYIFKLQAGEFWS